MAKNKAKSQRKFGREKRKAANRGSAISLFVRGKISGTQYFSMTNQKVRG